MSELTPQYVLAVPSPDEAAEIVVQRLIDSGFEIKPAD
jgi:hypothetical protein